MKTLHTGIRFRLGGFVARRPRTAFALFDLRDSRHLAINGRWPAGESGTYLIPQRFLNNSVGVYRRELIAVPRDEPQPQGIVAE